MEVNLMNMEKRCTRLAAFSSDEEKTKTRKDREVTEEGWRRGRKWMRETAKGWVWGMSKKGRKGRKGMEGMGRAG